MIHTGQLGTTDALLGALIPAVIPSPGSADAATAAETGNLGLSGADAVTLTASAEPVSVRLLLASVNTAQALPGTAHTTPSLKGSVGTGHSLIGTSGTTIAVGGRAGNAPSVTATAGTAVQIDGSRQVELTAAGSVGTQWNSTGSAATPTVLAASGAAAVLRGSVDTQIEIGGST